MVRALCTWVWFIENRVVQEAALPSVNASTDSRIFGTTLKIFFALQKKLHEIFIDVSLKNLAPSVLLKTPTHQPVLKNVKCATE